MLPVPVWQLVCWEGHLLEKVYVYSAVDIEHCTGMPDATLMMYGIAFLSFGPYMCVSSPLIFSPQSSMLLCKARTYIHPSLSKSELPQQTLEHLAE